MQKKYKKRNKNSFGDNIGFTLVELMVSLSIFVVVMMVVMGSILSILNLNSKVQSKKTAMDNLNFGLETMSRTIRFGSLYHCGTSGDVSTPAPVNCPSGANSLTLRASDGSLVTYTLTNGALMQTIGGNTLALTSPEVTVNAITFWVLGALPYGSDSLQPRVIISITATAGSANKTQTQTTFKMETTISQRKLDI